MEPSKPLSVLRSIARQIKRPIRGIQYYDPSVCRSPLNPKHPWQVVPIPGDLFQHELRLKRGRSTVSLRVNDKWIIVEVLVGDAFTLEVPPCTIKTSTKGPFADIIPDMSSSNSVKRFLKSPRLNDALAQMQLRDTEKLKAYRNGFVLYLQRSSANEVLQSIEILCDLMGRLLVKSDGAKFDDLPRRFYPLVGFIKKWAISDDSERDALVCAAPRAALTKLVKIGTPYLPQINEYLDSFGKKPLPQTATALGNFAECVCEAQRRLEEKVLRKQSPG